jgi:hypothetical protein
MVVALTGSVQSVDQAQTVSITATVSNDAKGAGVTWSVSGGGSFSAQTPTSATYKAPTSVTTAFTATITATSISDATKTATLTIKVSPPPSVTTTTIPAATAGTAFSATLSESGGTSPFTWAITAGTLPAGLSLNASTGAITGTPTGTASNTVTFQVTDAAKMSASLTVTITVNAPPALSITTTTLPGGTTGTAYSQTLQATGGVPSYTWSKTAGSLPAGLTLSSAGVISGTPSGTFTGTSSFTVTLTDSQTPTHATVTAILSITVSAPPLSVTTASLAGGSIGTAYSNQTLQAAGGISPYTWAVTTGSLPTGLTLNAATGVISGTPSGTFVGTDNFTVTVTDAETPTGKTASANLSITISVVALSVTTSGSLPTGVVNSVYPGATLQAAGGITPYSWTVTTGSLPAGLVLNGATGVISGTPTASGTSNFTVTVTDSETPTAKTATANLTIVVNPAVIVTTTSLPAGVIGTAYSQALGASGGIAPYTWTASVLPAGLSLNAATGVISGTPSGTFTGTLNITVTVTDSESPTKKSAAANLSITISAPTLSVTTTTLAGGTIGNAYTNQTLQAAGGISPYSWAVTTGSLPTGLTLNAATGVISGTPSGTFVGTDNFTVTVTDSETPTQQTASANLSITISVAPLSVTTSGSLTTGVVSSVYPGATLQASGGITPYSWAVTTGSLPAGLVLNAATGVISGTPTASGTSNFTVTVTDSETPTAKTATANLSITVNPTLSLTTTSPLPAGVIGTIYPGATLQAAGGISPYTWAVTTGSLPAGLTLNPATGAISGTPGGTFTGAVNFTVTVTDNESPTKKTATANLSITISAPALSVTTTTLAGGSVNIVYTNQTLQAAGGIPPYSWAVTTGSLPTGLILNAATGVISGTPTGTFTGTDNFTVTVTDSETPTGKTATANLSITISVAALSVTTSGSLTTGVVNSVYSGATLQAAGGITPYSWAVTTGSLPAGLVLNAATGAISGTPTASGTLNFTVTVTDSETPTAKTATANLSITVNPAVSVTTTSPLPAGVVGTSYPGATLQAAGGTSPYTWAVTTGSLPAGLTLNPATGAITGTPTGPFVGTTTFTVTVTDNESPTKKTATANLSITISAPALSVTTTSLPTGVLGNTYSANLQASGGVTPYTWGWVAASGSSLPPGLSLNSSGAITGTPTATGTFNVTVKATDSETPTAQSASANLSISINNSAPLTITNSGLPNGVVNTSYQNGLLQANGGVQPYTWSISVGTLPAGLILNANTGAITGTPTGTGTTNFTVKVTDSTQPTATSATASLSITINAGLTITTTSVPNGSVGTSYNATVSAAGGLQPYNWSVISGSLPPGLSPSNNNNSLNISGTPTTTGPYTFTLQVTDSENTPVSVSNSYTIVITNQPVGYTVSGTVSYGGSKTGRVYLQLASNNCGGCNNNLGTSTSLTSGGAFTIHGVQPGTYTLQSYMDNLGFGAENASNPTGSVSNVTVVNAKISGVSLALTDPAAVTLSSPPVWKPNKGFGAFSGGVFISFQTIQNNNGIEMPASYTVQWSTSSSFSTVTGSMSFPATGGNNPWIVNGLTNGTTYFFRAQGVAGSSTSNWSTPSSGIVIGAPTGGNTISGKVTFNKTATGPLYVGFYDQNTGNVYATVVGSKTIPPTSPASYSVQVPNGSNYYFFGIIDQNNSGLVGGPGQISNTNGNNAAPVVISGPLSNENLTLSTANSIATVTTQTSEQINSGGTTTFYGIGFNVNGLLKLPVAVELATGPTPGAVIPADIANGGFTGNADNFSFFTGLNGVTPQVGDQYTLNVTYSDGTSEVLTVTVSAVLNAYATNLVPQGSGASVTPNFSWTDPASASSYFYQFQLWDSNGNQIWQIPGNNSNSNGFSSSITSITWNVDPTGSGSLPNVSSLNGNSSYNWQITTRDANGNSAQVQVTFTTAATPLTLPPAGSVGSTTVGQNFNGAINASGGTGPYNFTVNSTPVPTDGTNVGDGLFAFNTGGNTLSLTGTPSSVTTVSFTVAVTDSASGSAGPFTYTITVTPAAPLSIETTSLPNGDNSWPYNAKLKANGGVPPYTWTKTSGNLPSGLNLISSGGSNESIAGVPTATGTSSFTIKVTDSAAASVTANLSITIGSCDNTSKLKGNYAILLDGWKDATHASAAVGSFAADGLGSITGGNLDINDQISGPQSGTLTGTYCVSSNNLAALSLTVGGGSTAMFAASLDSTGNGHIVRYDETSSVINSGLLRKQTTTAFATSKIKGNFAFGFIGVDESGQRMGMAGEFNSNGSGTLAGEADADDNGSALTQVALSSSNFNVASATNGRGTVQMNFTGQGTGPNFVFYVVSATEMLFMDDDVVGSAPLLTGQALQQVGSFTNASLNGNSVIELQAVDTSGGSAVSDVQVGIINANGVIPSGSFSLTLDENDGGVFNGSSDRSISGNYSIDSKGRMTLSNIVGGGGGNHTPVFYLYGPNQAFVIDSGGSVSFGTITGQTGSNFTASSLSGEYLGGGLPPVTSDVSVEVDDSHLDGIGTLTGTSDSSNTNCGSGNACPNSSTISASYVVSSNGRTVLSQGSTQVGILYIISSSQAVFLPTTDSSPALGDFHQ